MSTSPQPLRPAATLVMVRDGASRPEVLLIQRTHQASFWAGGHTFPGGAVDSNDHSDAALLHDLADETANAMLSLDQGAAAYFVAAIRECFEEVGLLLATNANKELVSLSLDEAAALRQQIADGSLTLPPLCAARNWRLATDRLAYMGHWVTPAGAVRRFDTRFFIAAAPPGQTCCHDNGETIAHLWITPEAALSRLALGELKMPNATQTMLREIRQFNNTDEIMTYARSPRPIKEVHPRVSINSQGRKVLLPDDFAYAEISRIDPEGVGTSWSEILPGAVTALSANVRRIAAPNPGFMTGPGTNSYLVGDEQALAVIDPGPALEPHLATLAQEGRNKIKYILTTHTHRDHSPGAARLKALTGAEVIGMPAPDSEFQDQEFRPDRVPSDGDRIQVGSVTLRVVHTPGHASNHCCYLLEQEKLLFTGDHIMQGSTVVINPPDGDMAVYLASLRKIRTPEIEWLAPGHGFLMDRPMQRIDRLLAHRQAREDKVIDCLRRAGPLPAADLVPLVYDDVPAERFGMAFRSLSAHLIKLQNEQRAIETDGRWQAA